MKRRDLIFVFIFVSIGLVFLRDDKKPEIRSQKQETRVDREPKSDVKIHKQESTAIKREQVRSMRSALPQQDDVKLEISQNPHKTPDSIINFAKTLGPLMEKGLKNADDADLLISELHECTISENAAQAAKALCLSNAQRLGRAQPKVKDKAEDLMSSAPRDVVQLLEKKNQLMKKDKL